MRMKLLSESGIASRVLFVALAPVIATALALAAYFTQLRYNDIESSLSQRGATIARQLAPAAQYGFFSGNIAELKRLAQAVVREPDVLSITFYDQHGVPVISSGHPKTDLSPKFLADGWTGQSTDSNTLVFHSKVLSSTLPLNDPYAEAITTTRPTLMLGSLTLELSRSNITARKREILLVTVGSSLLILFAAALLARRLGRDISEPVVALENAVYKMREGHLNTRVQPHRAKTLRALEEGINSMAASLEATNSQNREALTTSEAQLRQQYEFSDALLTAQSDAGLGMLIIDSGRINLANDAALMLLGYTREEMSLIGSFANLIVHEDSEKFLGVYRSILEGGQAATRADVNVIARNGSVITFAAVFFKMQRNDSQYVVVLGLDITQRKRDAERLRLAYAELQAEKDAAQRASVAKSRFLAAASHDLRQPLHALSLFTGQLQERITAQDQTKLIEQIRAAHDAMSELLSSLLDISKLDLANPIPHCQPVELGQLFEQVAATHRQTAATKQLRLIVAPTSLWGLSDPPYLIRIISNLVANAVRYTDTGSILIGARRAGGNVRIEIWDTGIGIAPENLPHVFQEFFQVSNPERDALKGLGLGLAIVDRLTTMLGHSIVVRSRQNKGSMFGVLMSQAPATVKRITMPKLPGSFEARIVVAVEDASTRTSLEEILQKWGCNVIIANGNHLKAAGSGETHDALICDRSHFENMAAVLSSKDMSQAGIIVVTDGLATEQTGQIWAPGFLAKPVRPAKLRALLQHLLARNG